MSLDCQELLIFLPRLSSDLALSLRRSIILILRRKLQADTVDAMSFICRGSIALSLENMAQMATTIRTYNLCSRHSKGAIRVSCHCAWYAVEVCWPATARLELMSRLVQRGVAGGASVDAFFGHMLVIFASEWRLGALFSQNAELFCWICQYGKNIYVCVRGVAG